MKQTVNWQIDIGKILAVVLAGLLAWNGLAYMDVQETQARIEDKLDKIPIEKECICDESGKMYEINWSEWEIITIPLVIGGK